MAGTINSLGLGSGVLTADVIDKLKANDETLLIKPIDSKLTLNSQKTQALDLLNSLLSSFKSNVSALDSDNLYQKRSVSGNNDSVTVTAASGTQIRDFSLAIDNIAKKSVVESGTFSSATEQIANGNGTLKLGIAGKEFKINYTAATTLTDLKQAINDAAGSDVTASVLQTGSSAFNLVITSKTTGENQAISLTDITGGQLKNDKFLTASSRSGSFIAKDDFIASSGTSGTLTLGVGATSTSIAYDDTTTLQGLVDKINTDSTINSKVSASIVEYGTNDFRMVLTPKEGSEGNAISIGDSVGGGLSGNITSLTTMSGSSNIIQNGSDAHFTFDGISMTRSTNTFSDIGSGISITLLKDGGTANIGITQNRDEIATSMESMVNSYNTLISQLDDMTAYNPTEGKVGIFNGDNSIKGISREITKLLTSYNTSGYSLAQYGISLDKAGVMSFDKSVFTTKMNDEPDQTEAFFSGKTTVADNGTTTITKGVFTNLNDLLNTYTSSTGLMNNLTTSSKAEATALTAERTKTNALLTARYDTMHARFAAYDSLISKLNSQFASLKQQIDAMANANN